jgi:hypothetical protein
MKNVGSSEPACRRAEHDGHPVANMSRPPTKKPAAEAAPPKMASWAIYRLKGTPAALLGHVDAPDEATAIKKAIDEFAIEPALHKRLLAQRRG